MAKTVFVGLSGGVDSAVSAALLKQATPNNFEKLFGRPTPEGFRGFNVVGVFIKIWQPEFTECTWEKDRMDAMRVAVALGIPFREVDLSDDYKKSVVEQMVSGYARGITPNPDVLCNRSIKFGSFWEYAKDAGADFIATGHYARIASGGRLLRGKDKNKDQSYFLYTLNQSDLSHTIFPVGHLQKNAVRQLARRARLPVAAKPDSQGLCFVGNVSMKDFLSRFIPLKKGAVLDMHGVEIGTHDGAQLYTTGQRHGFVITKRALGTGIYFVVSSDVEKNTITVSEDIGNASRKSSVLNNVHWVEKEPALPFEAEIQTRYREIPIKAVISRNRNRTMALFSEPHLASSGQSLVAYDGERCLGGGVILN